LLDADDRRSCWAYSFRPQCSAHEVSPFGCERLGPCWATNRGQACPLTEVLLKCCRTDHKSRTVNGRMSAISARQTSAHAHHLRPLGRG
jgi:hypothetical protein